MNQHKTGNRVVVIPGTAPVHGTGGHRQSANQQPTARRTVVIRNGEMVGLIPPRSARFPTA